MSLLYIESFDAACGTFAQYFQQWTLYGGMWSQAAGGRRGTYALKSYYQAGWYASFNLGAEYSGLVIGFAVLPQTGTANTHFFDILNAAGTVQFVLDCTAAGRVRVKTASDGSVLAESADGAITFDIYQYLEMKFTCDGDDTIQIKVDGVDVIASTSGLNLRQAGSGAAQKISWYPLASAFNLYTYLDDLYICDLSGAKYNDFMGDVKIDIFWPTADGYHSDFTPDTGADHFDAINNNGSGALTHYIEEDTITGRDSFSLTPTGDLPTIHAIEIRSAARNSDTGVAEGTPFIRMASVDYDQAPFERGDTIEHDCTILTARPDTGGALTKTFLEDMEFGWEFSAAS